MSRDGCGIFKASIEIPEGSPVRFTSVVTCIGSLAMWHDRGTSMKGGSLGMRGVGGTTRLSIHTANRHIQFVSSTRTAKYQLRTG
jgi:hypothetical protein